MLVLLYFSTRKAHKKLKVNFKRKTKMSSDDSDSSSIKKPIACSKDSQSVN